MVTMVGRHTGKIIENFLVPGNPDQRAVKKKNVAEQRQVEIMEILNVAFSVCPHRHIIHHGLSPSVPLS